MRNGSGKPPAQHGDPAREEPTVPAPAIQEEESNPLRKALQAQLDWERRRQELQEEICDYLLRQRQNDGMSGLEEEGAGVQLACADGSPVS